VRILPFLDGLFIAICVDTLLFIFLKERLYTFLPFLRYDLQAVVLVLGLKFGALFQRSYLKVIIASEVVLSHDTCIVS
jgi:hypothetical protein